MRQSHHLSGPVAAIQQAFDKPQPGDLLGRVQAFAMRIAPGLREVVAPLPDSQSVLGQAGITLDRRYGRPLPSVSRGTVHRRPLKPMHEQAGKNMFELNLLGEVPRNLLMSSDDSAACRHWAGKPNYSTVRKS
jgi:hypothetical protein